MECHNHLCSACLHPTTVQLPPRLPGSTERERARRFECAISSSIPSSISSSLVAVPGLLDCIPLGSARAQGAGNMSSRFWRASTRQPIATTNPIALIRRSIGFRRFVVLGSLLGVCSATPRLGQSPNFVSRPPERAGRPGLRVFDTLSRDGLRRAAPGLHLTGVRDGISRPSYGDATGSEARGELRLCCSQTMVIQGDSRFGPWTLASGLTRQVDQAQRGAAVGPNHPPAVFCRFGPAVIWPIRLTRAESRWRGWTRMPG